MTPEKAPERVSGGTSAAYQAGAAAAGNAEDSRGLSAYPAGESPRSGDFFWNSLGGMLNAFQSVFLLMVITRVCGLAEAGIFSIAFATGNLFMYLGNYGVRNYQVSDLQENYSFPDYLWHRFASAALMAAASAVTVLYSYGTGSYSARKALVVAAMCVLKTEDCLEEVFEGRMQQRGRLDEAGKTMTVRLLVSIGGMIAVLVLTKDLLTATWAAVVLAYLSAGGMVLHYKETVGLRRQRLRFRKVMGLMRTCFPVCVSNFLSFYLINAPKYAIDAAMDETAQARYNFIAMPVFVIQLLGMFIYQPLLIRMTVSFRKMERGEEGGRREFRVLFLRVCGAILAVSAVCLAGAYLIGTPVLGALYATDLSDLRAELMIILVGGVFLAFCSFLCAVLTLMRAQKWIPISYVFGTALSLFLTPALTEAQGIRGAVVSFMLIMAAVTILLGICYVRTVRHTDKRIH